jgi:outer membrane protein assembly factor BamD (BamD/ComL family)
MVEATRPMRVRRSERVTYAPSPEVEDPKPARRWRRVRFVLLWVLGFVLLIALTVGVSAYWGLHQGERDREQQRIQAAEEHYRTGLERLDAGELVLAVAEFEHVLKLNPEHPFAQQGIDEAEVRMKRLTAVPTPTSEMREAVAADLYEESSTKYQSEQWEDAISVLTQLRSLDPAYRTEEVEEMLFTSLYNAGIALLDEERFEEGVFYLDQAVALRPLDEIALTERSLAIQYMTALGYWGVDWELCIERFEQLHATAPDYKDVLRRLYRAHVMYADAWYGQGEMCPAEEQYTLALQLMNSPEIEQKRGEAAEICLVATPTPIAPVTGTMPIVLQERPPGFNAGRLAYPIFNGQTGVYDVYALFAEGRLVRMATAADQPWWWGSSGTLLFRNRSSPGIGLQAPGENEARQLASGAGLTWPTFSPDGTRLAYAVKDAAGTWQIYVGPSDGSTVATLLADGKGPVWGPAGLMAWTGCDGGGGCGIMVDNPDDDQPPTRLTASYNDVGLNWSPDGSVLAYMSDVSGNWDIYRLGISGDVVLLTDDPGSDGLPAWAPDGSGLAFVSNRDGSWGVYLMGPNGEDPHKILALGPNLPDWTMQRLSWAP